VKREIEIMIYIKAHVSENRYLPSLFRVYYDKDACDKYGVVSLCVPLLESIDLNDLLNGQPGRIRDDPSKELPQEYHITELFLQNIMVQLIEAVSALHAVNICHFDIKLDNIVLKKDDPRKICLIDLGKAHRKEDGWATPLPVEMKVVRGRHVLTDAGTTAYLAPEFFVPIPPHKSAVRGPSCDVWAIGCVLSILMNSLYPFGDEAQIGTDKIYANICREYPNTLDRSILPGLYNMTDDSCNIKTFRDQLLFKKPSERLTLKQAREHPWIQPTFDHKGEQLHSNKIYRSNTQGRLIHDVLSVSRQGSKSIEVSDIRNVAKRFAKIKARSGPSSRPNLSDDMALTTFESSLNFHEFETLMKELGLHALATMRIFCRIDTDNSNTVDFTEFIEALLGFLGGAATVQRPIFDVFDVNGDGNISYDEFQMVFSNNMPEVDTVSLFREVSKLDSAADYLTYEIGFEQFTDWYETGKNAKEIVQKVLVGPLFTDVVTDTLAAGSCDAVVVEMPSWNRGAE
jgi:serine/threonine protein kinase